MEVNKLVEVKGLKYLTIRDAFNRNEVSVKLTREEAKDLWTKLGQALNERSQKHE